MSRERRITLGRGASLSSSSVSMATIQVTTKKAMTPSQLLVPSSTAKRRRP
jgi:hypothetical protein